MMKTEKRSKGRKNGMTSQLNIERLEELPVKEENIPLIPSVNFHLTKACNYACTFCFARFNYLEKGLELHEAQKLLTLLVDAGTEKITFVGGEPFLHPQLGQLIQFAKGLGVTTMIVTNGSLLTEPFLHQYGAYIDWIGFSIDSGREETEVALGRHPKKPASTFPGHVQLIRKLVPLVKSFGIRVKINTVVIALNWEEDMNWLITELAPARWKVFQVSKIVGENDEEVNPLLITSEQFEAFISTHKENHPVAERTEDILGSYIMIDPQGCFVEDSTGALKHSAPILEVGVNQAFEQIRFSYTKFCQRGGLYNWASHESLSIETNSMR